MLGEVALVPYDSPISNTNQLFLETLFDENAACHIALGDSFPECIENGPTTDKKVLLEEYHMNDCDSHVDFMIGNKDMNILSTELHIGAMRNNNSNMLAKLGLDTGFDSIAEDNSIKYMSRLFDRLNSENALPKTIVFNLNPKMNTEIMTLIGCFQSDEAVPHGGSLTISPAWKSTLRTSRQRDTSPPSSAC